MPGLLNAWERLWVRDMEAGRLAALRVVFFGFLALDCLHLMTAHAWRSGAGGWNLAHLGWLDRLLPLPDAGVHAVVYATCGLLALLVAAGLAVRRSLALLTVLYAYAYFSSRADGYQHHYLICWLLLLSNAVPFAETAGLEGPATEPRLASWGIGLLYAQVSIVYFFTAVTKVDPWWLNGWALEQQVATPWVREGLADLERLLGWRASGAYALIAHAVMLWQLSIAPAFLWKRLRPWACATGPLFHLMVEVIGLEIRWFSWYMIALYYLLLFPERWYAAVARPLAARLRWPERRAALRPLASAALGVVVVAAVVAAGAASPFPRPTLSALAFGLVVALAWPRRGGARPARGVAIALSAAACVLVPRVGDAAYDFYRFQGGDLARRGEVEAAIDAYRRAIVLNPGPASRHRKLAELLERSGQVEEALLVYRELQRLAPGSARAAAGVARCEARLGL